MCVCVHVCVCVCMLVHACAYVVRMCDSGDLVEVWWVIFC